MTKVILLLILFGLQSFCCYKLGEIVTKGKVLKEIQEFLKERNNDIPWYKELKDFINRLLRIL